MPPMASKWPSILLGDAADGIEMAQHFIERRCRWPGNGPAFYWGTPPMASKWPSISLGDGANGLEAAQHVIGKRCRWRRNGPAFY
jgi:hypothetical protein